MSEQIYSHKDRFYLEFERRFRGSIDLIRSRLQIYVGFFEPLRKIHGIGSPALDLGCGRGEWLSLLTEHGFSCHGVDLDEGMLESCQKLGLSAEKKDALAALGELPDNSQSIVSGFHLAEHLPFETLMVLVEQAHRVLKPGGLLILETPNPENLRVGATSFYLDPSHERPLPSPLLAFVGEFYGFKRVKVLRLQEDPMLRERAPELQDVLEGVSPDYAVVAQKAATERELEQFDPDFSREFGIGLVEMSKRYQLHQQSIILRLEGRLDADQRTLAYQGGKLNAIEEKTLELENRVKQLESRFRNGPLRLRQLFRHPKVFFKESFGGKPSSSKYRAPFLRDGFVDNERGIRLSLRWMFRRPAKAIGLFVRQPGKMIRFIVKHPGKFIKGSAKGRKITGHSQERNHENTEIMLSPEARAIANRLKRSIEKNKDNAHCH